VLILSAIAGAVLLFEKRLIYFPARAYDVTPVELGLAFEDVRLIAEDGVRLQAWFLPVRDAQWTVLVSHGNAGNIGDRLDRALLMQARLRANVFLYDYRGYGSSEGSPDEEGTYRDARAAYRWLVAEKQIAAERLVIFGESLGCAVSLDLALAHPAAALVLEAPFTSIRDMARTTPLFALAPFVRTRYDNLARVPGLRMPLLVVHGDRDRIVPLAQGRRLFDAAPEPKRFHAVAGAGHNDAYVVGGQSYWDEVRDLLSSALRS
jgi:uncharacterized protein